MDVDYHWICIHHSGWVSSSVQLRRWWFLFPVSTGVCRISSINDSPWKMFGFGAWMSIFWVENRHHSQGQVVELQERVLKIWWVHFNMWDTKQNWLVEWCTELYYHVKHCYYSPKMGSPIDQRFILMGEQHHTTRVGWLEKNIDPALARVE